MIANHADLIARLRADYLRGDLHVSDLHLMREAADALASCDKAMEEVRRRAARVEVQYNDAIGLAVSRAEAAESALATERARVVHEIIAAVRSLARIVLGDYSEGYMYAIGDVERAIRALIPGNSGDAAPVSSTPQTEQESTP